jgi:hypothetical protein
MTYTRLYADETGESHYEDIEVELTPRDFAPPAPPLHLSPMMPATGVAFVRFPAGWDSDHRSHGPGSVVLLEDTAGKGHRARVVGSGDVLAAVVQLPD